MDGAVLLSGARLAHLGYVAVVKVDIDVGAMSVVLVPVSNGARHALVQYFRVSEIGSLSDYCGVMARWLRV